MNIFSALAIYAQNKIGKLMYDTDGNAYLYDTNKKEFKDITIYPQDEFRPYISFDWKDRNREEKIKKWKDSFDNIRVYSVKVGEEVIDGDNKPILRYGFINEKGYAITHATYDRVEAFQNGYARVYVKEHCCNINRQGHPMMDGKPFYKAEFVFNAKDGFVICCTDGKYGLINKYHYLCVPCEYDSIVLKKGPYGDISHVIMEKNEKHYSAIIDGDSVCNIIDFAPKSMELRKNFLVIEEEFLNNGNTYFKLGLLNRGGVRILNSEYDSIEIVARNIGIVSKNEHKQLLLIGEKGYKVYIDSCNDIKYGESYNEERQEKYSYASVDERDIVFIEYEDQKGLHSMENNVFRPEDALEYDSAYFDFDGKSNDYIAVVLGDKAKLVNLDGEEFIPLVIPSEYHVLTNTYSEGIVGISISKKDSAFSDCSYINSEGKILTDFKYFKVEKFENGEARAHYDYGIDIIDRDGKILYTEHEYPDSEPPENNWAELRDDAFEGDSDAYWNID